MYTRSPAYAIRTHAHAHARIPTPLHRPFRRLHAHILSTHCCCPSACLHRKRAWAGRAYGALTVIDPHTISRSFLPSSSSSSSLSSFGIDCLRSCPASLVAFLLFLLLFFCSPLLRLQCTLAEPRLCRAFSFEVPLPVLLLFSCCCSPPLLSSRPRISTSFLGPLPLPYAKHIHILSLTEPPHLTAGVSVAR